MEEEETGAQSGGRRRGGRGTEPQKRSRDFILVSEFSEHVGPVPVMVKPEGGAGLFNTSSFSVRIMSSDMQRALTGGCFSFSEDTQMVLSERMDGLYAYVHYFSLYDINARGYVRQLAISYITSSLKKITDNFADLLEKFSEVTKMLCCGNHKVFGKDVEHRLADLEFTKELISQEGWTAETTESSTLYKEFDFSKDNVPERDPAVVESGITEMKTIMESLKKEMEKDCHQQMQLLLESKRRCFQKLMALYSPAPPPPNTNGINDAALFLAQTSSEQSLNGSPHSEFSLSSESSHYQPQRAMAHYVQRFERRLRDLKELTSKAYLVAMEKMDFVYKHFSRSESALEMEKEETQILYPHSSVLTLGRVPIMNVLANVMMSSRPHLHEMKPYVLCCKEVDPRRRVAPPTYQLDLLTSHGGFDKTFAEDSNALNKCPFYLNPAVTACAPLLSDSLSTPQAPYYELDHGTLTGEPRRLPVITGAEEREGGGSSQVLSSGEYTSGNSPGFHTPQEFTPGNSPRSSTVEAESRSDGDHTHLLTSSSPAQSSQLLSSSTSPNRTITSSTVGQQVLGLVDDRETGQCPVEDRETGQRPVELSSIHDSLILAGRPEGGPTTELRDNATFSPLEETAAAGCGQLESLSLSRQQDSITPTQSFQSEVKVRTKTPPPVTLPIGTPTRHHTNSLDVFTSPARFQQSMASSVATSREMTFSPSSLLPSPDKGLGCPQIVYLPRGAPLPFLPSLDQVEGDYRFKPGRGLAKFCKDHMCTRDLLYCLLQGRTLVIIGDPSQENLIRRLVRVLWMFVPGHSSVHQVIPWRERPLSPEDIARVKLVGLCQNRSGKPPALPLHMKNYVSFWDCSPGAARVWTPPYEVAPCLLSRLLLFTML
jgi:hypothetical protein